MTVTTPRRTAKADKSIRDVEPGTSYGFPYVIQFDPNDWTFPMTVDGDSIGIARSQDEARTTISTFCEELARHTRATTADMAADAAAAQSEVNEPAPPRTVDELQEELHAVNSAIIGVRRGTDAWDRLDRMRKQIVIELNEAHRHRTGICRCGSRAVTPDASLCPYHAAIEQVSGEAVPYAALGEDPEEDEDTDEQSNPADEDVYAPVPVSRPGACRGCGGAHHIQACNDVRAALMAYDKGAGTGGSPVITIAVPSDDPCADVRAQLEQMTGFCKRVLATWDGWDDADTEIFYTELGQVVGDIRETLGRETIDARSTERNIRRLYGDALAAPKDESSAPDNSDLPF